MKIRFTSLFILILLFLMLASGCAAGYQGFRERVVALPNQLTLFIQTAVTLAFGWVFAQIGARWPWFVAMFGKYTDEMAFAVSAAILATIQQWLNLIPTAWESVGNYALLLIVALLAAFQIFKLLGKLKVPTFRTQ